MASVIQVDTIQNSGGTSAISFSTTGYVTLPNQPAFHAVRTAGDVAVSTVIIWDAVVLNKGNCYNNTTGRFTAPTAGTYAFWMRGDNYSSAGFQVGIRVNGSTTLNGVQYGGFGWSGASTTGHASAFAFVTLSSGDYVDVQNQSYGPMQGVPGYNNGFGGFLLS